MKRTLSLLLLGLAITPMHADDASKRAKVQELFSILKVDQLTTQIMNNVRQQTQLMSSKLYGANMTPEQQAKFSQFQDGVFNLVQTAVGWKVVEPDYIKLYTDTYTEPEIDGMLAFYKSPVGQTMLAKSPELAQKSMAITQQRMATIQPQLQQMAQDFVKSAQSTPAPPTLNSLPPSTTPAPPASSTPAPK